VCDDLRPRLAREARRAAEVIGVRVRDDHGMDIARLQVGLREARSGAPSTCRARQARIDDRGAALVGNRIAVDVAEAGQPDRQLHAQHASRQLGDSGRAGSCS
jgi:hypothetical protein